MEPMRAIQLIDVGRPVEERQVDVTPPGPNDVVVEVKAAGICHSDVHYRSGPWSVDEFPMTLGHEVAGVIVETGSLVDPTRRGERVALHYQTSCGSCTWCSRGSEQFCRSGRMLGKGIQGGYAEALTIPARNAFALPEAISFQHGAVMMCSSSTSLHALRKARMAQGETVAVFGSGGLGMSAVQIALAWGAGQVFAVDLNSDKLALASRYGATPVDASAGDPVTQILDATGGAGVDISLEVVGLALTMAQAIDVLGVMGRAVAVGITDQPLEMVPFSILAPWEREIIGCTDHLAQEIPLLFDLAVAGKLVLDDIVTGRVALDATEVNGAMDRLQQFGGAVRTVIVP
jgi:D-arabinose 1-dehydrogenase-like Zn-dependent alcohol dehydrogenase